MTRIDPTFADFLGSSGFPLAAPDSTEGVMVSVRRAVDGHTTIRSWILDPRLGNEADGRCRADAKSIADGVCTTGETLVLFSVNDGGCPAILQIGYGALNR